MGKQKSQVGWGIWEREEREHPTAMVRERARMRVLWRAEMKRRVVGEGRCGVFLRRWRRVEVRER